jgi:hypothetical protein
MTWMALLVLFIFGAVVLGSGVMFSPAWPTRQPRIALAGALALALVVGGAVFWAYLSGWDTLVVDYMLFALVTGIFLGGTLSSGQSRAEKRGEILSDAEQGWTGPEDLLFFAGTALAFALPLLIWNAPLGDLDEVSRALAIKLNGTFEVSTPFAAVTADAAPSTLFAPGFAAISAYISHQINVDVRTAQVSIAAVVGLLGVWLIYDLGSEVRDKRLGRAMAVALLLGFGWFNLYTNGAFPTMMALVFTMAFVIYQLRYLREGHWADLIAAGLMLGATLITQTDVFVATLAGYIVWLGMLWLSTNEGQPRPPLTRWLAMLIGMPLVAGLATAPYLVRAGSQIGPAYNAATARLLVVDVSGFLTFHNPLLLILAAVGAYYGVRRRDPITLFAVGWAVILIILYGLTSEVLTLPFAILGGLGLLELWGRVLRPVVPSTIQSRPAALLFLAMIVLIMGMVMFTTRLPNGLPPQETAALDWVRQNTPLEATVLNTIPTQSAWLPLVAERRTVDVICETGTEAETSCNRYTAPDTRYDYAVVFLSDATATTETLQQTLEESEIVFDNGAARVYRLTDAAES